ncbi:MAG: Gldg family protein, partial [Hominimerdicola sp.]
MNNDNNKTYTVEEDNKENVSTSHDDLLKDVIEEEKAEKDKNTDKDNKKEKKKKVKTPKSHKKLKHATMSTILTCVFLAVLVLVNVVTTMLFDRYPITIDLTADKIYSVSEDSEEYVKNVDTDVLVTIFNTQDNFENYNDYTKQAFEVLKRYCQLNPKISYRFVDIDSNPEIVSEYTDSVSTNEIIFETNTEVDGETIKRTRSLGLVDLLSFNDEITEYFSNYGMSIETGIQQMGGIDTFLYYYGSYVEASNAEQAFTSALMTVTDPNPVYVTFLTGRSELTELSYFQTLLTANGYNVNTIDITAEEIPENTDVIVIPSPKTDYLEAEITKISDFLNNDGNLGKNLIYCANVQQEDTPNLNEFLAEYGLEIGEGAIGEGDSNYYYANQFETLITDLSDSFTQDVETESPKLLSGYSKPVNTLFDEQ